MANVVYRVALASIDAYVVRVHGRPRELTLAERRVLIAYADRMVEDVANEWPVDTGFSRDHWASKISGRAGQVAIILENSADYVSFIHRAGTPEIPPLWTTLLPEVVNRYAARLLADLRAAIDRTEAATRQGTPILQLLQRDTRPRIRLGGAA